ncbi:MAG: NAD(P)/FAD-dependent oxidoreductase [bacterium]|nr:NAD(P)/FAD-dependent oxidoreductase [bacterium]
MSGAPRVIVVGAGPVGCVAAAVLARRGVHVTLLEAEPALPRQLRASTFHPATLDLLAELDVTGELIGRGLIARHFAYRDRRAGVVAGFDLGLLADVTAHPYRLQCEQFKLCEILLERLGASPAVTVRFGHRVSGAADRGDHATVTLADGSVHGADFVLAADGASSAVRKSLGLAFEGMTYEDRYLVVSTPHDFAEDLDDLSYVNYISDPDEWLVLLRTVGLWRALFPVGAGESDAEALSEASVQRRLGGIAALPGGYEVAHRTIYRVHQRVAPTFRAGRVLLAGDAAHINNPLGGMGMNGGIHDAFLLAHALGAVCAGVTSADRLSAAAECRRRLAVDYLGRHTHRNARSLAAPDGAARRRALAEMAATAADPGTAREYLLDASMLRARWAMDDLLEEARGGAGAPAGHEVEVA